MNIDFLVVNRKLVLHSSGGIGFAVLTLDPEFGGSDSEGEFDTECHSHSTLFGGRYSF